MSNRPVPQPGLDLIAPYVPGRSRAANVPTFAKLSSNESPLGASPAAQQALAELGGKLAAYPDGGSTGLREALGAVHGLDPARIVMGDGSGELLHLLAQIYLGPGDEAVVSQFAFLLYPIAIHGAGATCVVAADKDYVVDVDAMLAAVTDRTKMVFVANPNNPTGTMISGYEMARLHAGLRPDILLVIDSAYAEYVTDDSYDDGRALVAAADNVVMVRTLSKIGLAALRIGWLYGPDHVVDMVNRLRGPFNINMAAQVAGVAAIEDVAFNAELKAHNAMWRDWISQQLSSNHVRILPSEANFVLALFAEDGELTAQATNQALLHKGIIVREMGGYGLPNALRISIGTEEAMCAVSAVIAGLVADV